MTNKNGVILIAFLILANLTVFCGCKKNGPDVQQMPPVLVNATKAVKLDVPWDTEYPAQVAGSLEVQIRAQVGGILKERLYNEGQYVKKDSVLFTIDPEQYRVALERAEASLAQVNTEVQKAQRDFYRMKELIKDNAVSQKDYDDSLSAYEKVQADYKAAKAVVDDAKINLGYTRVKAPISGIARKENHSVGSLISTMGDEALLTTMVQINPLYINFSLPSKQLAALKKEVEADRMAVSNKDVKVDILIDGKVYKEPGKIIFVDSAEDPNTASIAVKAEVKNPNYSRDLTPGQFIRVRVTGVTFKDAVIVPQGALVTLPTGGFVVYTINTSSNNIVEAKPVEAVIKDSIAVVASGLSGDETVITSGALKVKPGMAVKFDLQNFDLPSPYSEAYSKQYGADASPAVSAEQPICQSCGAPLTDDNYGTEAAGSRSADYCRFCYKDGKFLADITMEQMVNSCVGHMVANGTDEKEAKEKVCRDLSDLKRWKKTAK